MNCNSDLVKCFVNSTEPANPIAESPAATIPKLKSFDQGAVIIRNSEKPTILLIKRSLIRVSPRKMGARSITHRGNLNSNAIT